jgi:hypothetical protein
MWTISVDYDNYIQYLQDPYRIPEDDIATCIMYVEDSLSQLIGIVDGVKVKQYAYYQDLELFAYARVSAMLDLAWMFRDVLLERYGESHTYGFLLAEELTNEQDCLGSVDTDHRKATKVSSKRDKSARRPSKVKSRKGSSPRGNKRETDS